MLDRIDGYHRLKVRLMSSDPSILLRASRLDTWVRSLLARHPDATVLSLGCGLDSRAFRLDVPATVQWYDVDYPDVVELRRRLYPQRDADGLVMYLSRDDVERLLARVTERFAYGEMVFDVLGMPAWLAKMTPYDMWGCPDPRELERMNPRLTLLEDVPVAAEYRRIPTPVFRAFTGLCNLVPHLRTALWPLRFRFGPPEEEWT